MEEDLPDEQNSFNIWESDQDLDPESVDFDSEAMAMMALNASALLDSALAEGWPEDLPSFSKRQSSSKKSPPLAPLPTADTRAPLAAITVPPLPGRQFSAFEVPIKVTSDLDWTQYRESRGRARMRTPRSASRACGQC